MLLDVRTYRCKAGMIGDHLKLYNELGKAPQFRNLGAPLCFLKTETGDPNEYIHIWVYDNAGDREAKRAKLWTDPDWLTYIAKSRAMGSLEAQSNRLMTPTEFCPFGGKG